MIETLRQHYLHQPHEVSIETFALCNARCTFCPYPTLDRKGVRMPLDLINRLIEQMSPWQAPFFVSPFKVNEPLLDDRLKDICGDIVGKCPAATLRLFTNGQPLTVANIDWIAALPVGRLEHLWVSLNSTDPQEYGDLMGLSYAIVERRLDYLHELVATNRFHHPVVVSRVTSFTSGAGPDAAVSAGVSDSLFKNTVRQRWPLFTAHLIKRDGWLGYVDPSSNAVPPTACMRWFELNIMATGQVALCCMDGTGEYTIGDVNTSSLLSVYNNMALVHRRETANTREGIEPCARCTY